jgi:hypothetical protein
LLRREGSVALPLALFCGHVWVSFADPGGVLNLLITACWAALAFWLG